MVAELIALSLANRHGNNLASDAEGGRTASKENIEKVAGGEESWHTRAWKVRTVASSMQKELVD